MVHSGAFHNARAEALVHKLSTSGLHGNKPPGRKSISFRASVRNLLDLLTKKVLAGEARRFSRLQKSSQNYVSFRIEGYKRFQDQGHQPAILKIEALAAAAQKGNRTMVEAHRNNYKNRWCSADQKPKPPNASEGRPSHCLNP